MRVILASKTPDNKRREPHKELIAESVKDRKDKICEIDERDKFGRTSLHRAARSDQHEDLVQILDSGAHINLVDNYGETPLHAAARAGSKRCTCAITSYAGANITHVLSGKVIVSDGGMEFLDIDKVSKLFSELISERTERHETQHFRKSWCIEVAQRMYAQIQDCHKHLVCIPTVQVVNLVLQKFDPEPHSGYREVDMKGNESWIESVSNATHLQTILSYAFRQSYLDFPNKMGQTALHAACFENIGDSHSNVIEYLVDVCQSNVSSIDLRGHTPYDLVIESRGRAEEPSESARESVLLEQRALIMEKMWDEKIDWDSTLALQRSEDVLERCCIESDKKRLLWRGTPPCVDSDTAQGSSDFLSARDWSAILQKSTFVSCLGGYDQYRSKDNQFFYVHQQNLDEEDAALLLQRAYRQRYCQSIPSGWTTEAFTFEKPHAFEDAKRRLRGWTLLCERSFPEKEHIGPDGNTWIAYHDPVTGEHFFHCAEMGRWDWEIPKDQISRVPGIGLRANLTAGDIQFGDKETNSFKNTELARESGNTVQECHQDFLRKVSERSKETEMRREEEQWRQILVKGREKDKKFSRRVRQNDRQKKCYRSQRQLLGQSNPGILDMNETCERSVTEDCAYQVELLSQLKNDTHGSSHGLLVVVGMNDLTSPGIYKGKISDVLPVGMCAVDSSGVTLMSYLSKQEDKESESPQIKARRKLLRTIHCALIRQSKKCVMCQLGCGDYIKANSSQQTFHENNLCGKRMLFCSIGCDMRLTAEEWNKPISFHQGGYNVPLENLAFSQWHQKHDCPLRLVPCDYGCGILIPYIYMAKHVSTTCKMRRTPCHLGCGTLFSGGANQELQLEEEILEHELDYCPNRMVYCKWKDCGENIKAKDMVQHRRKHIHVCGITTFNQPGVYEYCVPERCLQLKVLCWGGGGGSGHVKIFGSSHAGNGGGGGFVEALLNVTPGETLYLCVGEGGSAGIYGRAQYMSGGHEYGIAKGGMPGGGTGFGSGPIWAAGGGGGYSIVQRKTRETDISCGHGEGTLKPLLVAGGGGGGASRDGEPGGPPHFNICSKETLRTGKIMSNKCLINALTGKTAQADEGGEGGESCVDVCCTFSSMSGFPWRGGDGSDCGAGGGGGFFGGGGGGSRPGISGGGGGGSCYVDWDCASDAAVLGGKGRIPGGVESCHVPASEGRQEATYDEVCGEGGKGSPHTVESGACGCIQFRRRGFYNYSHLEH